ncbi:MAG TPA: hypothetical protein VEA99_05350 [Gemmatimonadaceae bacterium]|nr:hypothetical protein [Gemmatimonadaceae bacterium]
MAHDTLLFLDSYRAAFERRDIDGIVDLFTFPCHVTGDGEPASLEIASSREDFRPIIQRILDAYERIGLKSPTIESVWTDTISPRLAVVRVGWHLRNADEATLYEFTSVYTLAEVEGRLRVSAVAHDELPKLRAALRRVGRETMKSDG